MTLREVPLASASDGDMSGCRDQLELGAAVRLLVKKVGRRCGKSHAAESEPPGVDATENKWMQEQERLGRDRRISVNGRPVALASCSTRILVSGSNDCMHTPPSLCTGVPQLSSLSALFLLQGLAYISKTHFESLG